MGQKICDYCSGSGRDAVTPGSMSCWKCHGMGSYWEADPMATGRASFPRTRGTSVRSRPGGGQYRLLPFTQSLLDRIPGWLKWTSAAVAGGLGLGLGQRIDPSAGAVMWAFCGLGAFFGYFALPATIVLTDAAVQLTVALVKLAIILGVIIGVIYGLMLLAG